MMHKFKMAMLLFVASESVFFAMLILAFADFNGVKMPGPDAKEVLHPAVTAIYTVCLLASSATLYLAERGARVKNALTTRLWLAVTIILGAVFLFGEGREWDTLLREHVTISRDLFGSAFFTLTGFHGLHVLIGLVILSILLLLTFSRRRRPPSTHAFEAAAIYWHFVDVVWIFVFSVVYIWGTR